MSAEPVRVLFICTSNACRSQMAEGLARWMGRRRSESHSAGEAPDRVHPLAIRAMEELGIDISAHASKGLEQFVGQPFEFVITVYHRAKETCPTWPGVREQIHWSSTTRPKRSEPTRSA